MLHFYASQFYTAHIFTYSNSTILFYRLLMDLVIILDRIALFEPRVKRITFRFKPWVTSLLALVIVCLINGPLAYLYEHGMRPAQQ